jgi:hypothetical protein
MIVEMHHERLRELGLDSMRGVMDFRGGEVVARHADRRDVTRIESTSSAGEGGTKVLFLKRVRLPYRRNGIKSLLTSGRVRSLSRIEWDNMAALRDAGFGVADLVAWGEECGPLWERFSFILTGDAGENGARPDLRKYLERNPPRAQRRQVLSTLARWVRRLHDVGWSYPDLFSRHIFVGLSGDAPDYRLIDVARLERSRRTSDKLRARDLAALNASLPMRVVSKAERVRFLHDYSDENDVRPLMKLIELRMRTLLKRSKFRGFADKVAATSTTEG